MTKHAAKGVTGNRSAWLGASGLFWGGAVFQEAKPRFPFTAVVCSIFAYEVETRDAARLFFNGMSGRYITPPSLMALLLYYYFVLYKR